jgi:hypothetical protein
MGSGQGQGSAILEGAVSDGPGGKVIRFAYGRDIDEVAGTATALAQCLAEIRLHLAGGSDRHTRSAITLLYQAFDEIADVERMVGPVIRRLSEVLSATSVPEALVTRLRDLTERAATARRHRAGTTSSPAAVELLAQAQAGLEEASVLESANERFATAHLAALRTAAAVLAARGGPREGASGVRRRSRIRSAWEVLPEVAPELTEWCALFAAQASRRARAEAGIKGAASMRDAEGLIRDAAMFLRLAERMLLRDALGHTPPGPPLGDDDDEWDE